MASSSRPPAWRIAVAGGGSPGLALALALRRDLGEAVAVTVYDPALGRGRPDGRAYALSAASASFLERLGILAGLATQPIRGMAITDSRLADAVRPVYLRFEGEDERPLGWMVEAIELARALRESCEMAGVEVALEAVRDAAAGPDGMQIGAGDGRDPVALLVACDGARSRLREAAGITWFGGRYGQVGIVATVAHERDHESWATQHFLPAGPFAILPLRAGPTGAFRSSIVWTETTERARTITAMPSEHAHRELEARFGTELGRIELLTPLSAHPLSVGLARDFVAPRLALVGDAAHEIHPLAGQGLNLALADAEALTERVGQSVRLGLDPGRTEVLTAYARDRRLDAVTLAGLTDSLNRLFSNDQLPVRVLRDIGLGLVDRTPGAKRFLGERAAGAMRFAR